MNGRRDLTLPSVDGDRVGHKVVLTVEAYVSKIEADLIDCGMPEEPGLVLPGDSWTTLEISKVVGRVQS